MCVCVCEGGGGITNMLQCWERINFGPQVLG